MQDNVPPTLLSARLCLPKTLLWLLTGAYLECHEVRRALMF